AVMAIAGAVLLMLRYKAINLKLAENWEEEYQPSGAHRALDQLGGNTTAEFVEEEQPVEDIKTSRAKKTVKRESTLQKKAKEKIAARQATKKSTTRIVREKKSS